MFYSKCASNISDNAGAGVTTASPKPWMRIAACAVATIAAIAIALFSLSGCGGGDASSGSSASKSAGSSASKDAEPSVEDLIKPTVNDYTWEELSKISEEIAKASDESAAIEIAKKHNLATEDGKLDGTQTKTVQLTDGTTATVQIAGFLHDDKTGGGKAGITFIFKDAIAEHDMNPDRNPYGPGTFTGSNAGGWEGSAMRSWLSTEGISMLPSDLTDKIVAVDKKTNNVGRTEDVSSVTKTSDKFWLFSPVETYGTVEETYWADEIYNAQGAEYKLFKDCNVGLKHDYHFLVDGFDVPEGSWWLRSPDCWNGQDFRFVSSYGWDNLNDAYNPYGVVPGFCI